MLVGFERWQVGGLGLPALGAVVIVSVSVVLLAATGGSASTQACASVS